MPNWNGLPNEILLEIFIRLNRRDVRNCSLLCHAWNLVAQRVLFKHIPSLTDQQLNDLTTALINGNQNQATGNLVKTINCTKLSETFDLVLLDKVFPHLEVIYINSPQQALYDQLYALIMDGRFANLKKIPHTKWNKEHLDLVLSRKEDIKELELRSSYMYAPYEKLHLFSRLEVLKLYCFNIDKTVFIETLLSKDLPSLKSIDFAFETPYTITFNASPRYARQIQQLPNLKEVRIMHRGKLLFGGETTYNYIMNKFADVETLIIKSNENTPLQTRHYDVPAVECISQFLTYLVNLKKKSTVPPIITDQFTNEVVEMAFGYVRHVSPSFAKMKLGLKIGFDVVKQKELNLYPEERSAYIIPYKNQSKNLYQIKVIYKLIPESSRQPYLDLFQRIGGMKVEQLTIGENFPRKRKSSKIKTVPVGLDAIFDYLINLKSVKIHRSTLFTTNLSLKPQSALRSLEFFNCFMTQKIFPKISRKCPNLKLFKVHFCRFVDYDTPKITLRHITINMPYSDLDELSFSISFQTNFAGDYFKSAFIRLTTDSKKARYCKVNRVLRSRRKLSIEFDKRKGIYTEKECKRYLKDPKCLVYDVYCKSVKKLTVRAKPLLHRDDPTNMEKAFYEEEL